MCHNEYGSYSCECLNGFIPKYAHGFECEDFDECSSECSHICDPVRSYCVNRVGTYECVCRNGFFKDESTNECLDMDECIYPEKRMDNCNKNAQCVNSFGSFRCVCKVGFYGNGTYCEGLFSEFKSIKHILTLTFILKILTNFLSIRNFFSRHFYANNRRFLTLK